MFAAEIALMVPFVVSCELVPLKTKERAEGAMTLGTINSQNVFVGTFTAKENVPSGSFVTTEPAGTKLTELTFVILTFVTPEASPVMGKERETVGLVAAPVTAIPVPATTPLEDPPPPPPITVTCPNVWTAGSSPIAAASSHSPHFLSRGLCLVFTFYR